MVNLEHGQETAVLDNEHARAKNALMMGVTLGRLALIPELVDSINDSSASRTALMVGAIVAADIADGVAARKLGVDTNSRRIADAVVDRASILAAFGAAAVSNPEVLSWYLPLAVRGGVVATGSNLCYWLRNKLVIGGNFHKAASLSQAALGVGLVANAPPTVLAPVAAVTYGINAISGFDYFGAHRQHMKLPKSAKLERVKVKELSGLRSLLNQEQH